jgi:hypothetical protein
MASFRGADAGTYYAVADGYFGDMAHATLKIVTQAAGAIPANDACAGAIQLTTAVPLTAQTTNRGTDGVKAGCGGAGSSDVAYKVTTTAAGTLTVNVTGTSAGFQPTIYLLSSCAGSPITGACVAPVGSATSTTLTYAAAAATSYIVVVDGPPGVTGDFTITATIP